MSAVLASAIGLAIVMGGATAANATTVYPPEGGTWHYGVYEPGSVAYVYSYYFHSTHWHRSSVIRGVNDSTVYRSGDKAAGTWANIEKPVAGLWGRQSFYYRYSY